MAGPGQGRAERRLDGILAAGVGRREFIALIGAAAAAWPLAARAQKRSSRPRIGIIDDAPMWDDFRRALHDLGYVEGQNISFEYRVAQGEPVRLADAAAELVRLPVDVISAFGTPASLAAKAATTTRPLMPRSTLYPQR